MKVGFLMGSFDPIHIGHVNIVREAIDFFDKIIIVISGHNPWKKDIEPAPFTLRMAMAIEAIKPFGEKVKVSGIESTFEPPYYANKPLNYFKELYPDDEKYIICGTDTVNKIPYWKNATIDILPFYKIICFERNDGEQTTIIEPLTKFISDENGNKIEYLYKHIKPISISSTYIRNQAKENKILYPLVTIEVENIIKKRKLYV